MTQLVSQVLPPSGEKACSHLGESGAGTDHWKRTTTGLPLKVSLAMNVPMPPSNRPTTGTSREPGLRESSHQIDQVFDAGS